jgi:hypothetical protein
MPEYHMERVIFAFISLKSVAEYDRDVPTGGSEMPGARRRRLVLSRTPLYTRFILISLRFIFSPLKPCSLAFSLRYEKSRVR